MNFFETELKSMTAGSKYLKNAKFTASSCIARLDGGTTVKVTLETLGTHNVYERIQIKVMNRSEGEIDKANIKFADLLGKDRLGGNVRIWYDRKYEWYAFAPTKTNYTAIRKAIDDYLENFTEE